MNIEVQIKYFKADEASKQKKMNRRDYERTIEQWHCIDIGNVLI